MSSSSVVSLSSFNLLFFTQVLTVLTSSVEYNDYVTDKGKNCSIPCNGGDNIIWVKESGNNSAIVQTGKYLIFTNISETDSGLYICFAPVSLRAENSTEETSQTDSNVAEIVNSNDTNNNTLWNNRTSNASTSPSQSLIDDEQRPETNVATTSTHPQAATMFSSSTEGSTTSFFEEQEFEAVLKVNVSVRTPPGPVTQLFFRASTILGFLIWRFNKTNSGGYPLRSFTAEYRNVSYEVTPLNSSYEHRWSRLDPINIAPNVRQMEVYRLTPNTTYEFRIWANNQLGSGEAVTTNVTTLPETKEEDLIRLIQPDLDNFDPRIWIVAVSIVLGTLVILAIGLSIVLSKECYQSSHMGYEDGWDSIELIPNIILNPGFSESDGENAQHFNRSPFTRTVIFGGDDDSDYSDSNTSSDQEPRMEKFKRKVSVFFTGPTIKRI